MPTLAYSKVGRVIVFACGDAPLDNAEWEAYLRFIGRELRMDVFNCSLVYAKSAQPTPVQREKLNKAISSFSQAGRLKSAVLTESLLVRTVITAMQWFNRETFRVFAPNDMGSALQFLNLDAGECQAVTASLTKLKASLEPAFPDRHTGTHG